MAKHNGCPECKAQYDGYMNNGTYTSGIKQEQESSGGQRPGSNGQASQIYNPYYTGRPRHPTSGTKHTPIDRQEIIRKIKSANSRSTSPELERPSSRASLKLRKTPSPEQQSAAGATASRPKTPDLQQDNQALGLQIERPRSAFHSGDFREKEASSSAFERFGEREKEQAVPSLSTSPVAPWHPAFPSAAVRQARQAPLTPPGHPAVRPTRSRAVSNVSLASSFIYKAPTSPLVQASRPGTPEPGSRRKSRSPDKSRRHTFSPQALQRFGSGLQYSNNARNLRDTQPATLRSERTEPYQAHQPQRSLNSFASLPQTPVAGARRPSFSDATMVGSYEESILRGRMSTTPSRPLNFVAQIGVLGKGECKSSLRCPPHATVPFPAVFYSYGNSTRAASSDQPSPYVGLIDLENNLPSAHPSPEKRRRRLRTAISNDSSRASSRTRDDVSASEVQAGRRRRQKQKRRSGSPKAPPGGIYRIPQQGQLQIVIKNPNKTAVKLFLVPYDLSDMEPGQKTFIRQRSYSAGPIIDMPLSSRANLGTDRPEAAIPAGDDPNDRPMLRYLVHLHICCPSRGRFYLYKSIRVVFANRVPDGKEKLRNEIQLPEPKYSTYKPERDSNVGIAANATPNDTARRRSIADTLGFQDDRMMSPHIRRHWAQSLPASEYIAPSDARPPMPPSLYSILPTLESRPSSRQMSERTEVDHKLPISLASDPPPINTSTLSTQEVSFTRKLDDPFRFERDHSLERKPGGRSESLISRRLKDLAVQVALQDADGGSEG